MHCLDNEERLRIHNPLSSMMHELVFLKYHLHFASFPYSFTSYSYSCKILQPYVAASVRLHSGRVLSYSGAPLMKQAKNNRQ